MADYLCCNNMWNCCSKSRNEIFHRTSCYLGKGLNMCNFFPSFFLQETLHEPGLYTRSLQTTAIGLVLVCQHNHLGCGAEENGVQSLLGQQAARVAARHEALGYSQLPRWATAKRMMPAQCRLWFGGPCPTQLWAEVAHTGANLKGRFGILYFSTMQFQCCPWLNV